MGGSERAPHTPHAPRIERTFLSWRRSWWWAWVILSTPDAAFDRGVGGGDGGGRGVLGGRGVAVDGSAAAVRRLAGRAALLRVLHRVPRRRRAGLVASGALSLEAR